MHPTIRPRRPGDALAAIPPSQGCVLLKHGEVFLRGRNRDRFVQRLHTNLQSALADLEGATWCKDVGNVTLLGGDVPLEQLVQRARQVIGFNVVQPAMRVPSTEEDIVAAAVGILRGVQETRPGVGFAVRARRRDKSFPHRYQPGGQLHVIPLGNAQKQLAVAGAGKFQTVAQRRLMARTADLMARRNGAEALVMGDSLGQVASQTLTNMARVDEAVSLPLLRPLIGWEKQEIIDEARSIGTAGISVLPDEDCCALLTPPRVSTGAHTPDLRKIEKRMEMDELVEELIAGAQHWGPSPTSPAEAARCS